MFESAMYSDSLDKYLNGILPPRPDVVGEMEEEALRNDFPIIGPQVGRLLAIFARLSNAKVVFEMGSGYGYSAYWFLQGMPAEGKIVLTDGSSANREKASDYLGRMGLMDRVEYRIGNAIDLLRSEKRMFDIIYNDVEKKQYPDAYRAAARKLRSGGLFITDNTLWNGKVGGKNHDETTRTIIEFNRLIFSDPDLFSAIIPIRDGLSVSVKR
jgi:caffeoyl-CoA O-methyltransferase